MIRERERHQGKHTHTQQTNYRITIYGYIITVATNNKIIKKKGK